MMLFKQVEENIKINLEKSSYSPGENISGKLDLKLNKPIRAKSLTLTVIGQKYRKGMSSYLLGKKRIYNIKSVGWSNYTFFKDRIQIDTEKEYFGMSYPFEYKIPENILFEAEKWKDKIPTTKIVDEMMSDEVRKETEWSNRWYLEAKLKISIKKDIKNKVELEIR